MVPTALTSGFTKARWILGTHVACGVLCAFVHLAEASLADGVTEAVGIPQARVVATVPPFVVLAALHVPDVLPWHVRQRPSSRWRSPSSKGAESTNSLHAHTLAQRPIFEIDMVQSAGNELSCSANFDMHCRVSMSAGLGSVKLPEGSRQSEVKELAPCNHAGLWACLSC